LIFLLHGADEFRISERKKALNEVITSPELRQLNVITLDAKSCSIDEILSALLAIPFMADKRIVYLENLSGSFKEFNKSETLAKNGDWASFEELLDAIPSTTTFGIIEGDLSPKDELLKLIRNVGEVEHYPLLRGRQLIYWIADVSEKIGIVIDSDARQLLADSIGSNLRLMESEINKLALYKDQQPITRDDVSIMVPFVREQSVFDVVDSAILGDKRSSLRYAKMLIASGTSPVALSRLIERQIRLMLLSKSLKESGHKEREISHRLSLFGYPLQKTIKMGRKIGWNRLLEFHDCVLQCDLKIKDGVLSGEEALDWLIIEMSS